MGSQGNKGTATPLGYARPPAAEHAHYINSPASQLQQPGLALVASPTAILKHERDKRVSTTIHSRSRQAG